MVRHAPLVILLVAAAPAARLAAAPMASPAALDGAAAAPLPAGLYFRGNGTCDGCPTPHASVIAGIFPTPIDAERALATAPRDLPLGYPLVATTQELGTDDRAPGIAVVLGLYAGEAEARRAASPGTRVVALLDDAAYDARLGGRPPDRVVRIRAGSPVPVFDAGDVAALEAASPSHVLYARAFDDHDPLLSRLRRLGVAAPGSVLLWRSAARACDIENEFVPVDWHGRPGCVRLRDTLYHATVVPHGAGRYHLVQLIGMSCDDPELEESVYSACGRGANVPRFDDPGCGD